jgi:hypothetical protein
MFRKSISARVGAGLAVLLMASLAGLARQAGTAAVAIDGDDIGGVITSAKGPEAGVWVIAQTRDLPTKFIKIVVTDDRGRYLLPDLPSANYELWVRGYGLVDSPKVYSTPGSTLNMTAVIAPSAKAAAQYYPANYWYALLEPPPTSEFPGRGTRGANANGIPEALKTQGAWLGNIKQTNACTQCHQMGNKVTREISPALGTFENSVEAWDYRMEVGVSGAFMNSTMAPLGRAKALQVFADWTDRIAGGELPPVAPPRPQGVERNIVVSQWEWAAAESFVHDEISTDRRKPTINANGPIYGVQELSGDWITILDPVKHTDRRVHIPPHAPDLNYVWGQEVINPSPYWGDESIWKGYVSPHNPMFDGKGRVWMTARGGCRVYEPKTDEVTHVPTCPGGHHLQIADDDVLWFDSGGAKYFDIKKWEVNPEDKSAGGHIPPVLDVNGNGKLDEPPVDAKSPVDATRDKQIAPGQAYSVIPNPVDGSIWVSYSVIPGGMIRVDPKTRLSEYYEVPYMNPKAKVEGYLPHGIDVDRSTGVIWMGLNSGHYAEFDRRKCQGPLTGVEAVGGQHCPEGWTLHQAPGPNFKTVEGSGTADSYYLNWVDWFNTSGFGNNTPMINGSGSDAIYAFTKGEWVTMRVPYPMGAHTRGMDGRIDDPNAGWKGRGIWSTHAEQATWHQEGGKGERPKVIKFQVRPDPLAK